MCIWSIIKIPKNADALLVWKQVFFFRDENQWQFYWTDSRLSKHNCESLFNCEGAEARRAGNLTLTLNRWGTLCKNSFTRITHSLHCCLCLFVITSMGAFPLSAVIRLLDSKSGFHTMRCYFVSEYFPGQYYCLKTKTKHFVDRKHSAGILFVQE